MKTERYKKRGAFIKRDGVTLTISQVVADLNAVYVSESAEQDIKALRIGQQLMRAMADLPDGWSVHAIAHKGGGDVELHHDGGKHAYRSNVAMMESLGAELCPYRIDGAIDEARIISERSGDQDQ